MRANVSAENEGTRRIVHLLFGGVAFLLPYFDWRFSLLLALFALFVNAEILPRTTVGKKWFRSNEGWTGGIILYPLTVAIIIAIYRENTLPVAASWLALAFGDPAAAFIGRKSKGPRLPWNSQKTLAGMLAFDAAALPVVFASGIQHELTLGAALLIALVAAALGSVLESLRWAIADNLAIGLGVSLAVAGMGALL